MMKSTEYWSPTRSLFGFGCRTKIKDFILESGFQKALIVTDETLYAIGIVGKAISWRALFTIFAFVFVGLSVGGGLLLPMGDVGKVREIGPEAEDGSSIAPIGFVKSPGYRWFFLWCMNLVSGALVVSGHAALVMADIGATSAALMLAVSVNAGANVLSRLLIGALSRNPGGPRMKLVLTACAMVGAFLCLCGYLLSSAICLFAGYAAVGLVNGGSAIAGNTYILGRYGRRHFGLNMAITNLHLAFSSFIGPVVAGSLYEASQSYAGGFIFMVASVFVSAACLWMWHKREKAVSPPRGSHP